MALAAGPYTSRPGLQEPTVATRGMVPTYANLYFGSTLAGGPVQAQPQAWRQYAPM